MLATLVMAPSPALADCVMAEAWYSTNGGTTKNYVIGPDHCVAPTPWPIVTYPKVTTPIQHFQIGAGVGVPLP